MSKFCPYAKWPVALCCLIVLGCTSTRQAPENSSPSPGAVTGDILNQEIKSEPVQIKEIREELKAAGNLTADPGLQSEVGSPVSGRIRELFVLPGARVLPGQPLARLNSPDVSKARSDLHHAELNLKLAQSTLIQRRQRSKLGDLSQRPLEEAQNELSLAVAEVEVAASEHQLSKKKLARVKDLLDHGIATQQELEEAIAFEEQARSRWTQALRQQQIALRHKARESRLSKAGALVTLPIMEAENELRLAEEEVYHSRKVLEDLGVDSQGEGNGLFLRAPLGGIVVSSSARLGMAVSADQQLFEILDPGRLWLGVYLYESDQGMVSLGMPVKVTVSTLPGKEFQGKISDLPPLVELPTRTLKARVVVDNPEGLLKVGMSAQAHIGLRQPRKALTVPVASVLEQDKKTLVFRKGVDGKFEPVEVELGFRDPEQNWVEVKQGLEVGQSVVTKGAYLLGAGTAND